VTALADRGIEGVAEGNPAITRCIFRINPSHFCTVADTALPPMICSAVEVHIAVDPSRSATGARLRSVRDVVVLCPPGFEELVSEFAERELDVFTPTATGRGLIRGSTEADLAALRTFPCATNAFVVLAEFPRTTAESEAGVLAERLAAVNVPLEFGRAGPPPLRVSIDGKLISPSAAYRGLETAIAAGWPTATGRSTVDEVWLLHRSDLRTAVVAARLSSGGPRPPRGQLRSEICAALARVEPLRDAELVLDPFAGSGAIGDACLKAGATKVWLNDLNPPGSAIAASPRVRWTRSDFRKLRVRPQSIDALVTDPPWGRNWNMKHGAAGFYRDLGAAAQQWLRPGGAVVLLTGAPDRALEALLHAGNLRSEMTLPVLVNGSRARVIRARKGRRPRRR
jgi:16S rRNA G966 N2-methylase RsmD